MVKNFLTLKTGLGGIVFAIFLTALLEDSFKSALNFIGKVLLTLSTLGLQKYKDQIYLDIAKGFYEQSSILLLSGAIGIIIAFSLITGWHLLKDEKGETSELFNSVNKYRRAFKYGSFFYIVVVVTVVILMLNQVTYTNKAIAYYKQLKAISAPFLDESKEEFYESRFASIKNQDDFVRLMNELERILSENNISLPKRPPFVF